MNEPSSFLSHLMPSSLIPQSERPGIPTAEQKIKRFRSLYVLVQLAKLFFGNVFLWLLGKRTVLRREKRVISCLNKLGTLWIRIAQTLIVRSPKLGSFFGLELLDLRDPGSACPFHQIEKSVFQELNRPLEEIFDRFEKIPFAASTFSQIHRARLREEQIWVAVKIQHPFSERVFNSDLSLFQKLITTMRRLHIQRGMRWEDLSRELQDIKTRELNFHYEAHALKTMDKKLTGQTVHVPRVYDRYCSQRILVMQFLQGALLSDCIWMQKHDPKRLKTWLDQNNIDLGIVGDRLFQIVCRQVFEHNFFHGDMHTGNIVLLRNSHFAFIECRNVGSLEVECLTKQKMFLQALTEGDYTAAAEIYFLMVSQLPRVDLNQVKVQLLRIWRLWETRVHIEELPFSEKSLTFLTGQTNRIFNDSMFSPLWSYSKLIRTWAHLDNALSFLFPKLNYVKKLKAYFHEEQKRHTADKLGRLPERMASAAVAVSKVPERISSYSLFLEIMMRREAQVISGSASKLDAIISVGFSFFSFLVSLSFIFLVFVFLKQIRWMEFEWLLGGQLSSLFLQIPKFTGFTWLVIFSVLTVLFIFLIKQKNRFKSKEHGRDLSSPVL